MILLQAMLALIAGALITFGLSPFDVWPLAWVCPAIFFALLRKKSAKAGFWLGWAFGTGLFGSGVSWVYVSISEHSATPQSIAIALTCLFVVSLGLLIAIQGWLFCKLFANRRYNWLAFAGLWVGFEWVRSWLFTGFPWLYLGYSTLDTPLAIWAEFGGVWLNSLWVILGGAAVISLATRCSLPERVLALLCISLPWLTLSQLPESQTEVSSATINVALLQPNIAQSIKWHPQSLTKILQQYEQQTEQHLDADIIIWPETAIPTLFQHSAAQLQPLFEKLDQSKTSLISGMPSAVPDRSSNNGYRIHNSVAVLSEGSGIYHKQRLVPFGEYVPMESYLRGVIDFFNLPASSFSLPQQPQALLMSQNVSIAAAICYEIAYPELIRETALGADLLLTISNDTWFGSSIAPDQHLQIARMRAIENGRWLIRATNNGISAIINPQGKVTAQAVRYEMDVLRSTVIPIRGQTYYQQQGNTPVLAFISLLLLISLLQPRKQKSPLQFRDQLN